MTEKGIPSSIALSVNAFFCFESHSRGWLLELSPAVTVPDFNVKQADLA